MIWRYKIPVAHRPGDFPYQYSYGCPVTIDLPGIGRAEAVYQFQGGGQECAVVHYPSGRSIAPVLDHHTGYPEQRARAAVAERLRDVSPERIAGAFEGAEVINAVPESVGVLVRWPS